MRLAICCCVLVASAVSAQDPAGVGNADRALLVSFGYGRYASAGDLSERYGGGFGLDAGVDYLPTGSPWQFGVAVAYGFGNEVKEDVLRELRTDAGFIIGNQRHPAEVALRQRTLFIGPRVGYTLPLGGNPRAGLKFTSAAGYFFSRIRLQPDPVQFVPQIDGARAAGYDRLAGGPALYQFVGYQQLALNRRLNFYIGGEATAAFARELRSIDVSAGGPPSDGLRHDLIFGLRAGLILPLYFGTGESIFY